MEAITGEMFAPPRTYGRMRLNQAGAWEIIDLEPHVAIRLKAVFPRVPKGSAGPYTLRRDEATDADLRWFMERYPLAVSAQDAAAMERGQMSFFATQAEMERILLPSYRPSSYVGLRPGQAIRGYQAQAIEIAARSKGLLLGDECGLGKTFTAAGFCLGDGRLPAAIVCQVHIQKQWRHVVEQFTTLRVHAIKKATPYSLPPADIYVFRYSQLAGWAERGNAARELDIMVRQATGVAKARHVADVVRILVESGEPVVLMGWHRAVYDIWLDRLKDLKPAMYTGTESATQKNAAKEAFLAGHTDLLIMSLRSAAGLDGLQARCSTMVFGELDWSPGVHHQCIERLDREGQTQPVTALFLVADEGSDPPIMEMLGLKASEAHQVIDPSMDLQPVANNDSRLAALVQRYLHRRGQAPAAIEAEAA